MTKHYKLPCFFRPFLHMWGHMRDPLAGKRPKLPRGLKKLTPHMFPIELNSNKDCTNIVKSRKYGH